MGACYFSRSVCSACVNKDSANTAIMPAQLGHDSGRSHLRLLDAGILQMIIPYVSGNGTLTMIVVLSQHVECFSHMASSIRLISSIGSGWPTLYGIFVSSRGESCPALRSALSRVIHRTKFSQECLSQPATSRLPVQQEECLRLDSWRRSPSMCRLGLLTRSASRIQG